MNGIITLLPQQFAGAVSMVYSKSIGTGLGQFPLSMYI